MSVERNGNWKTGGKPLTILFFGIISIFLIPSLLQFIPFFKENEAYDIYIQSLGGAGLFSFIVSKINSFLKFAKKPALHLFNSLSKIPSFKHVLGIQEEIHKELISLIKAWGKYLGKKDYCYLLMTWTDALIIV